MPDLQREFGWPAAAVGPLTSAVQFGFIGGALVFLAFFLLLPLVAVFSEALKLGIGALRPPVRAAADRGARIPHQSASRPSARLAACPH